jgi:hypothetical protein
MVTAQIVMVTPSHHLHQGYQLLWIVLVMSYMVMTQIEMMKFPLNYHHEEGIEEVHLNSLVAIVMQLKYPMIKMKDPSTGSLSVEQLNN